MEFLASFWWRLLTRPLYPSREIRIATGNRNGRLQTCLLTPENERRKPKKTLCVFLGFFLGGGFWNLHSSCSMKKKNWSCPSYNFQNGFCLLCIFRTEQLQHWPDGVGDGLPQRGIPGVRRRGSALPRHVRGYGHPGPPEIETDESLAVLQRAAGGTKGQPTWPRLGHEWAPCQHLEFWTQLDDWSIRNRKFYDVATAHGSDPESGSADVTDGSSPRQYFRTHLWICLCSGIHFQVAPPFLCLQSAQRLVGGHACTNSRAHAPSRRRERRASDAFCDLNDFQPSIRRRAAQSVHAFSVPQHPQFPGHELSAHAVTLWGSQLQSANLLVPGTICCETLPTLGCRTRLLTTNCSQVVVTVLVCHSFPQFSFSLFRQKRHGNSNRGLPALTFAALTLAVATVCGHYGQWRFTAK